MKLLALDANSIINRAYYGIRPLSTHDGVPTNAIFGFMNILNRLIEEVSPDVIAAAFDLKAPTFRHKMYADYKAGRKPMPDDLREQFPYLKELLAAFGCVVLEKEGYEADDILGTLSAQCCERGDACVIATGDRDSLQLVSDCVSVMLAATKAGRPEITVYTPELIHEKYGVSPPEMIEIKALQGDSSDNIPGVAGIGEKTAGALIAKYHSIDYIYDNMASLDERDALKNKLLSGKESAFMSRELGTICRSAPIGLPPSADYLALRDEPKLKKCLVRLEMNKLADKLGLGSVRIDPAADTAHTAPSAATRVEWISAAAVPDDAVICYCAASNTLYAASGDSFLKIPYFDELLRGVRGIVIHDAKSFYHSVHIGFEPQIKCDTMLAAYLISPEQSDYELTRYAMQYDIAKPDGQDEEAQAFFALNVTGAMYRDLSEKLHEFHQQQLLETIEIPLCYTLYRMESAGFAVDRENIIRFGEELQKTAEELQTRIFELIGYEFNLNSPKQLGEALFEKLGLPSGKKTKTGYSTSAEVLEGLRYQSDAVEYLLRYRAVSKLKSTYCDGLVPQIDGAGRIHSTLKQTETRTGRISSAEPNLQNIPVRTELGRQMRRYFTAGDGRVLVDADYSQIELRVLAAAANDETMIDAFMSGEDIHAVTASQVFNVPLEAMTADLRSKAKAVNFGIVYGIGAFSLSKDIHVSVAEAKRYIDGYLSTYHGVRDYLGRLVESAREKGYAETLFGRRRYLPELSSSNHNLRAFGERVAKNMPIQGTAADIIKIAMIHVDRRLEREYPSARLIMQVHDELIVECLEADRDAVCAVLKEEMENAVKLAVPMIADVHSGKTWFDAK